MPLRDHFHPPLSNKRSSDALHGGWPMVIAMDLNDRLPPAYLAEPQIHLGLIGQSDPLLSPEPPSIYAVACRWRRRANQPFLETWTHPLALGEPLPTLPLWLASDLAIPLNLELTYEQTCRALRIL